jgi:dihydroorotase
LYVEVFEQLGALPALEGFASHFGPDFYRLPRNADTITLRREDWQVAQQLQFGRETLTPLRAGETVAWRVLEQGE